MASPAGAADVPGVVAEGVCPLITDEIIDVCIALVKAFNRKWMWLYGYQEMFMRRIIQSLLLHDGDTITTLWSRQAGKSACLAALAPVLCLYLPALGNAFPKDERVSMYRNGLFIGIFAPVEEKTKFIFDPLRERCEDLDMNRPFYAQGAGFNVSPQDPMVSRGDRVAWSNRSYIVTRTASEQSNKEGATFHLVIIDEAQQLSEYKKRKEINPMLSSTLGTMAEIGTADITRGGFYHDIMYNLEQQEKTGKQNHFEFPWEKVCFYKQVAFMETGDKFHTYYEIKVRGDLARDFRGNQDAAEFKLNYRLLWKDANLGAVDMAAFDLCAQNDREVNEPRYWCRQVAGLDLGKVRDVTILTVVEIDPTPVYDASPLPLMPGEERTAYVKKTIIAWYAITGRSWYAITNEVVRLLANHVVDTLVCDATGVGDPVTEMIAAKAPYLGARVIPYPMSAKGNDRAYKLYLSEIEALRMGYAAGPVTRNTAEFAEFVRQHEILQRVKVGEGVLVKCEAPEGEHDDYVDSSALACYAASLPQPEQAEQAYNPVYQSNKIEGYWGSGQRSREDHFRQGRA